MSTSEALRFFGLDFYATATDIKSAYRRLAVKLRPDPATSDAATLRAAEEGMQRLNRAYAALLHRVDNTPPEDLLQDAGAGPKMTLRLPKLVVPRMGMPRFAVPEFALPKMARPSMARVAVVGVVMAAVAYGIVHGVAQRQRTPAVVDAETVAAPRVAAAAVSKPMAEVAKPVHESEPAAAEAPRRALRAPKLPGLAAEDAKAITETCRAEVSDAASDDAAVSSETPEAFRTCVVQTAQATPHPIHLD